MEKALSGQIYVQLENLFNSVKSVIYFLQLCLWRRWLLVKIGKSQGKTRWNLDKTSYQTCNFE